MAMVFVFVVAAIVGFVGYDEAAKYERQHEKQLFSLPPRVAGVVSGLLGLAGAFLLAMLVVALLVAYVAFREVALYERLDREGLYGITPPVGAAVGFSFGLFGAVVTQAWVWGIVCGFLALIGALLLSIEERNRLVDEKRVLVSERNALLAEKDKAKQGASTRRPVGAAPTPVAAAPAAASESEKRWLLPLAAPEAPRRPVAAVAPVHSTWPGQVAPAAAAKASDTDLLPRRR
jgi:MFS family permease